MTLGQAIPQDPERRKVLVVLDRPQADRLEYEGTSLLRSSEAHVLRLPVTSSLGQFGGIADKGLLQAGSVLVQSPFEKNDYEDALEAEMLFSLKKCRVFSTFCMYLGAREVIFREDSLMKVSRNQAGGAGGRYKLGSAGLSGEKAEFEELKRKIRQEDRFVGGPADLKAAERWLQRYGLGGDQVLLGFLDNVRGQGRRWLRRRNRLERRELEINLSKEARRSLAAVGRLTIPPFVDLRGNYKEVAERESEYALMVDVCF